jgi:hypothetical protein
MSALHLLSIAPSSALLATAAISSELSRLQQLAEQHDHSHFGEHVAKLAALCQAVEHTVSQGVHSLASAGCGLEGLLELLAHAEDKPLPAIRVASLLTP